MDMRDHTDCYQFYATNAISLKNSPKLGSLNAREIATSAEFAYHHCTLWCW